MPPSHKACWIVCERFDSLIVSRLLRPIQSADFLVVREVYVDAIESQGDSLYSKAQIQAWTSLAYLPGLFDRVLSEGRGWLSFDRGQVAAFAVRDPFERLSMLYCRGQFARRGHATALLNRVELDAYEEGQTYLVTEASLFSFPLLLRSGWNDEALETIKIAGVNFKRYRMYKKLEGESSLGGG